MKKHMICGALAVGLLVGVAGAEDETDTAPDLGTTISELPEAVKITIKKQAPNGKIDDIDKETRTGKTVYEITFQEPGNNPKMHIAEDGTVVKSETITETAGAAVAGAGTELDEVPAAVQKSIKQYAPNAKVADIDKETRSGSVVYEVQFEESGKNPKMHFSEDGTLIKGND